MPPAQARSGDRLSGRVQAIRACEGFVGLGEQDISALAAQAISSRYQAGEYLMRRGQSCTNLVLIVSGVAQLSIGTPDGQSFIVGMGGRGTLLGDFSEHRMTQLMDVSAHEPVDALLIAWRNLKRLDPLALSRGLNRLLSERLQSTLEALEDLALFNLRPRLARLLARMHHHAAHNPAGRLNRYNQGTLAAMAGATRPRVNEHLQYFRKIGAIDIEAGLVLVRHVALLDREAHLPEAPMDCSVGNCEHLSRRLT